jgi:hypothetical protein
VSEIGTYRFKPGLLTETLMNDFMAETKRQADKAARTRATASA